MARKKSLYELLGVLPHANDAEIRAAYQQRLQALEGQQAALGREDYVLQMRLLRVACNTLTNPASRDAYDAQRVEAQPPDQMGAALQVLPVAPQATDLRTDAMLLRAEAMALRANALELKADSVSGHMAVGAGWEGPSGLKTVFASVKKLVFILGTLAALGMVFNVISLLTGSRHRDVQDGRSAVDDKVFLQEYYQTYGVRPASRAEAQLLDAERRKTEAAQRAKDQEKMDSRRNVQSERDFEEAARRRAEQASAEMRYAEEKAQRAEEEERRRKEDDQLRRDEAERARIEAQQDKWHRVLGTSGNN